jgi:hypothetical protein
MGDFSIYNSIRSSKVTTGNAGQYQGMRTFDDSAQVCPVRSNVSDYGVVGVSRDSINTYTAGCFSALDRMEVENIQRPRYSVYLNANAINDPGVGDNDLPQADNEYQSKPYYDTQLGHTWVRPVQPWQQTNPQYSASQFSASSPDAASNAQVAEANTIQCIMDRTYENRYCSAGA